MSKQDRQGARTVAALEQRYSFGKSFAEVQGFADDARRSADEAQEAAEYIKTGELSADRIKTGVIKSVDENVVIDLDNGTSTLARGIAAEFFSEGSAIYEIKAFVKAELIKMKTGTTKDFVLRVDDIVHPNGAALSITKYINNNGELSGVARFEWSDGSVSIVDALCEGYDDDEGWYIDDMEWSAPTVLPDEEYRTTERYRGYVVYTKLVFVGSGTAEPMRVECQHGICQHETRNLGSRNDCHGTR